MRFVIISVVLVIVLIEGLILFSRAVFGGSIFRGGRRARGGDQLGGPPGPRPDGHLGANRPTGGGGVGGTDSWAGGDWH